MPLYLSRDEFYNIIEKVLRKIEENVFLTSIVVALYFQQNEWQYSRLSSFSKYRVNHEIEWDGVLKDILDGSLDLSELKHLIKKEERRGQFNKKRFHPPPDINTDIFTPERREFLEKICEENGMNRLPDSFTILSFHKLLSSLENKFGLSKPDFVIDRKRNKTDNSQCCNCHQCRLNKKSVKNTFKAKYKKILAKEDRIQLPQKFQSDEEYKSTIGLIGILRGRMKNIFCPSVQAVALAMDKVGLSILFPNPEDPYVDAFVSLVKTSHSRQKLFTIDSQMHGGLDKWMKAFLDIIISRMSESITPISQEDWKKIFFLVPSPEVSQFLEESTKIEIYELTLTWMRLFSILFQQQWELGVNACSSNKMMVPSAGTTKVQVHAWNSCAGAWGNLLRTVRLLGNELGLPKLNLYKVLKLTAGDQMQWAEHEEKGAHVDTDIFHSLTSEGYLPWAYFYNSVPDFSEKITEKCILFSENPQKWIGGPCIRMTETKGDVSSLCGIVLPSSVIDDLKDTGAFGSKPWGN
jgi:hypothetical protein